MVHWILRHRRTDSIRSPTRRLNPDNTEVTLSGATVSSGTDFQLGHGDPGSHAYWSVNSYANDFTLAEKWTSGTPTVPLPSAAWTGITGLLGLGLVGSAKKLRKFLA